MAQLYTGITKPFRGCGDGDVVVFVGRWAIGATGAVGTQTRATGLSLARSGVGAYTMRLVNGGVNVRAAAILHPDIRLLVNDADPTNDTDGHQIKLLALSDSAGTVTFQCEDEGGTVREAPSGAIITAAFYVTLGTATR